MTYLKTALITSALAVAASGTAYADGHKNHDTDMKAMDKATVTATTETPMLTKANDTVGEILQADGQPDTQSDYELLSYDGKMITKAKAKAIESDNYLPNNAIVVPSSTGAITTVNCPSGTEAQPDMTCLITGETKFRNDTLTYSADQGVDATN